MTSHRRTVFATLTLAALSASPREASAQHRYFAIRTVDGSGRPLAGVRLRTTNEIERVSDRNGVAAFYEPGLMGRDVWFTVERAGYEHAAIFGLAGRRVTVAEGASVTLTLTRTSAPDPGPPTGLGDVDTRLLTRNVPEGSARFRIRVIDAVTGRGIPMAEVRSPASVDYTDSAGLLAFYDLDRIGQTVRFDVSSQGYAPAVSTDLRATPGTEATVRLQRTNLAERLYRITGAGIYRESAILGAAAPTMRPLLNGDVMGQDSTLSALYRGRVFWIWGDTNRPEFPLGNFWVAGATSALPTRGGLAPSVGVDLTYFTGDDGFCRSMIARDDRGPVWLGGLVTAPDARGDERLFANYGVYPALADPVESGLVRFDDATQTFVKVHTNTPRERARPTGNAHRVTFDGRDHVLFDSLVRMPALAEAIPDPARWEVFTPYRSDGTLDRDGDGTLRYAWRRDAPAMSDGTAPPGVPASQWLRGMLVDPDTGARAVSHGDGHTVLNPYRGRYVRFVNAAGVGTLVGDIWYLESDSALGPWSYARRVVGHTAYSMYNPRQHPFFAEDNGRVVYFEGTYTRSFSSATVSTPRYDYNQQMFRLDLGDPRMALPVAIYDLRDGLSRQELTSRAGLRARHATPATRFDALDRPTASTVAFRWTGACADRALRPGDGVGSPVFYAVAPSATMRPSPTVALYEYARSGTGRSYATDDRDAPEGARRGAVVGYVWPRAITVRVPVEAELPALLADAGDDQCVGGADAGTTRVMLDGSRSRAPAGVAITRYVWREGARSVEGARAALELSAGLHAVTLTVTDAAGASHTDEVLVEVRRGAVPAGFDASVEPLPGSGADSSSCGCRASGAKRGGGVNGALAALVLAVGLRRRASRCRGAGAA